MKHIIGNIEVAVDGNTQDVILYDAERDQEIIIPSLHLDLIRNMANSLQMQADNNSPVSVAEIRQKRLQLEAGIDAAIQSLVGEFSHDTDVTVSDIELTSYEIQNASHEKFGSYIYSSKVSLQI